MLTSMTPMTAIRQTVIDLPWSASSRLLGAMLTSDEWASDRAHLVGRTNIHFVIAVRSVEAAEDSLRFRFIADSPDLRHPVVGSIELIPTANRETALTVGLTANLDEEPARLHLGLREALTSLADILVRTIAATASGEQIVPEEQRAS
jgi:hypothetical protein